MRGLVSTARQAALIADKPVFAVRKKPFTTDYYVMAEWRDGYVVKVARFRHKSAAQYWIDEELDAWLARRNAVKISA